MTYEVAKVREAVGEVLEAGAVRSDAAWAALRGERVGPPLAVRRWPWAVAAALLGAAAGAGLARFAGRLLLGQDAPDAQDPADLQAVVDRAVDLPAPTD